MERFAEGVVGRLAWTREVDLHFVLVGPYPLAANPGQFHLIVPFELDSSKWLRMNWIDQYSGKQFKITTQKNFSSRTTAKIKTYGDVVTDYEHHPESKCADENGNAALQAARSHRGDHPNWERIKLFGRS